MGWLDHRRTLGPSFDLELNDPALAYLYGPGLAPAAAPPVAKAKGFAPRGTWASAWPRPTDLLAEDETLLQLDDGGLFQIREAPAPADFDVFVDVDDSGFPGIRAGFAMNLDFFPAEFAADLAVFEGIGRDP
jgi:hypothetical protein